MAHVNEYYGSVTKVEQLWCLDDMGIAHTCLLEARDAYPGYYSSFMKISRPKLIFIMSNQPCTLEQVTRMTAAVKKEFHHSFDAACCEITMKLITREGIRIKGIDDYSIIKDLHLAYVDQGLDLQKKKRDVENEEGLIKVRKFFRLEAVSENIYLDAGEKHRGYFRIPEDLEWDRFKEIIIRIRSNWTHHSFDAAKCFIYRDGEIVDLVRIFTKKVDVHLLETLREAFLKASEW
ncbi:MAG: hypothetical protein R6V49_11515 [Bacteroidales bacterium]